MAFIDCVPQRQAAREVVEVAAQLTESVRFVRACRQECFIHLFLADNLTEIFASGTRDQR
ncbi:hypothetical protein CHELA20_53014 [Hyphomicrobiales bacterium]|nr:hypothetical protein CHELA41_21909 [Hyphomicrobiales bacterium]CAH1683402.1 hypothetical protein CHELA20_53014 [Hyphomicrobiales bacterium]